MSERLLRAPEVMERTGLKRSTLYLRIKQNRFPRAVPLGDPHIVAWPESQVSAWVDAQIAAARPEPLAAA